MQSKTEDFIVRVEISDKTKTRPEICGLYEEFSERKMDETIELRRESFSKADLETKRDLLIAVEGEIDDFRVWLEEVKDFEPTAAHYYSVSLKSLLLGLPVGVQIAELFDTILSKCAIKH